MSLKKNQKKSQSKIAVLLATYNGEKYLRSQIDSILKQNDVDIQIVISDDKSSDESLEIIQSLCKQHNNVSCINKNRMGGPAKNFYYLINHIDHKHFDYIALSDQDDIWPDSRLSHAIEQLEKQNADAYSSDVIAIEEDGKFIKIIKKSQPQKKYDYFFETPGPGCSFVMSTKYVKYLKNKFQSNPALNKFPYHDWLIYSLARQANFKWYIDDAPNLFYRQHRNNFMGANYGFVSRIKRINRILFGEYYRELLLLNSYLQPKTKLNFYRVWFFIINFIQTRRKLHHAILMVPFLMILSIQKNDV